MLILINHGYVYNVHNWLDTQGNLYIGKAVERDDLGLTVARFESANFRNLPGELYKHFITSNMFFTCKFLDGYFDKYKYIWCFYDTMLPCHGHFLFDAIHDIKKQNALKLQNDRLWFDD